MATKAALALSLAYLVVGIVLLPDYGPTWDPVLFDYPYGVALLDYVVGCVDPAAVPLSPRLPHPNFEVSPTWYPSFPLGALLSSVSCRIFWTELGLLPAMVSHHLVIVVLMAVLLFAMVRFLSARLGVAAGLGGGVLLVLSPRCFAHSFNNLKDSPEACLYSLTVFAAYLALTRSALRWWLAAGALCGFALAQKANALFIPVQLAVFLAVSRFVLGSDPNNGLRWSWKGLGAATATFLAAYFAASPLFWSDTVARVKLHFGYILSHGTVPEGGEAAAGFVEWWSGLVPIVCTTPPTVLALALTGLVVSSRCSTRLRLFLLIWLATPILRTVVLKGLSYGGVRHNLELFPPLCAFAGLGLVAVLGLADRMANRLGGSRAVTIALRSLVVLGAVGPCALVTARTHPNGVCYFNSFVGGLAGAQELGVRDATDYWGNSYWQGLEWLDGHAAEGGSLLTPIAPHIVVSAAPVKLRQPLKLVRSPDDDLEPPLFVMYITRPGWYGRFLRELVHSHEPAHEVRVQGGVILRIHRIDDPDEATAWLDIWKREVRAGKTEREMFAVVVKHHPERMPEVRRALHALSTPEWRAAEKRLRALVPESAHGVIPELIWLHGSGQ